MGLQRIDGSMGHLYLEIQIHVPEELDQAQKRLITELSAWEESHDPRAKMMDEMRRLMED